jgi:hypothetical protein
MAMVISYAHNATLDKIEKQTVEEMISKEQHLQVKLKKVSVAMEMGKFW